MSTHKVDVATLHPPEPPVIDPPTDGPATSEPATVELAQEESAFVDVTSQCATVVVEPDPTCSPLWIRLVAACIYLAVASASVAGGVSFFFGEQSTSTDWVFGTLAFGLAFVAAVGVKESLFPSDWRPD